MKAYTRLKPYIVSVVEGKTFRTWASRAFIISILVYLIVIGYLVTESVRGASKWAPYGVNIPAFVALIISSEVLITLTGVWIFKEDSGIWPQTIYDGWGTMKRGRLFSGLKKIVIGAWDISIIDLRLRTRTAVFMGRLNRIAALAPLGYALSASAGSAPWGLRGSALFDVGITLAVWAAMELIMVRPETPPTRQPGG